MCVLKLRCKSLIFHPQQPREPGTSRQDQAMLLADSSEDEFWWHHDGVLFEEANFTIVTTTASPITLGCLAMIHLTHRVWLSIGHNLHRLHKGHLCTPASPPHPPHFLFLKYQYEYFSECCQVMLTLKAWQGWYDALWHKKNEWKWNCCLWKRRTFAGYWQPESVAGKLRFWFCGVWVQQVLCQVIKGCRNATLHKQCKYMYCICSWLGVSHCSVNKIVFLATI